MNYYFRKTESNLEFIYQPDIKHVGDEHLNIALYLFHIYILYFFLLPSKNQAMFC